MQHRRIDELRKSASISVAEATSRPASRRRERLRRFAAVVERHQGRVRPFWGVEYAWQAEAAAMRVKDSPLAIAYQDAVLRMDGLLGDRFGDGIEFFQLSRGEAHYLLCGCHYHTGMTPKRVALRARAIADKVTLSDRWALVARLFSRQRNHGGRKQYEVVGGLLNLWR